MASSSNRYSIKDVEKVVKGIEGKISNITISKLTRPGDSFVSLVFQVDFDLEKNGKSRSVSATESVIAKRLPVPQPNRDFAALGMKNEIKWYKEILPMLKDCAIKNDVDTDHYALYMGSRLNMNPELTEIDDEAVLLLKNLKSEGYQNEDRFIGFDLPTSKAALKMLAHFHAGPLVMKFKQPEAFESLKEYLQTCQLGVPSTQANGNGANQLPQDWFPTNPAVRKPPTDMVIGHMMQLASCQTYKIQLEAMRSDESDRMAHKFAAEPWNTIVHGDFWVNNIMIKPRIDLEPRMKMLDFQFLEYGSFGLDVVFFLLSSIQNDVQNEHLDDLIKYYYDELTKILSKQEIDELTLSYEDYLNELKRCAKTLSIHHLIFFSCIIFGPKDGPDVSLGEIQMLDHLKNIAENMNQIHKDKLELILKLAGQRATFQKRLRREKRTRKRLQDQLDLETNRRAQLEEALRNAGAAEQLDTINEKLAQQQQTPIKPPTPNRLLQLHNQQQQQQSPMQQNLMRPPSPAVERPSERVERIKEEIEDPPQQQQYATSMHQENAKATTWGYSGLDLMSSGAAFWQNYSESLAQELEMERKSRLQQAERDVKSPLQGYYKNSVMFTSSAT